MSSTHPSHHSHNYRILVVDDESGILSTYQEILAPSSQLPEEFSSLFGEGEHSPVLFEVEYASNGQNALEKVEQAQQDQHPYSVIFMDVRMPPGMDGFEAAKRIRKVDLAVYIVFVSAYSDYEIEEMQQQFQQNMLHLTKPFRRDELYQIALTLNKNWNREQWLQRENARLKAHAKLMEHQAYHDGLTGVFNRHHLNMALENEIKRAYREKQPISLLMSDVDWFKRYNDQYGHLQGDHTLRKIAQCIEQSLHRPADFVARYGGEEFCVVLPNTDLEGVQRVAETIRANIEALQIPFPLNPQTTMVTSSIGGVSTVPASSDAMHTLLAEADLLLYQAKQNGRNQAVVQAARNHTSRY